MELLLENEDKLQLSWHPGCSYHNGRYDVGAVGRIGPSDPYEPWVCPAIPSSLSFNIRFKNKEDIDLFNQLSLIKEDGIEVKIYNHSFKKEKIKIKDEFIKKANEITIKNEAIRDKCDQLIEQLEELGCNCYDIYPTTLEQIPLDWYEWQESYDATLASITVLCHDKTHFYLFLKEHGILDKYFPEWYRLGKF